MGVCNTVLCAQMQYAIFVPYKKYFSAPSWAEHPILPNLCPHTQKLEVKGVTGVLCLRGKKCKIGSLLSDIANIKCNYLMRVPIVSSLPII